MTPKVEKLLIGKRFLFDPADNSLVDQWEDNELTRLGTNESRALQLLAEEPGAVITRQHLHNYVWRQQGFEVDDSSITQAISTLRKALKDSTKSPEFIKTVPKRGYQIIAGIELYREAVIDIATPSEEVLTPATGPISPSELSEEQHEEITTPKNKSEHKKTWLTFVAIVLSILIPIIAIKASPTVSSSFTVMFELDGTQVVRPANHPDLEQWTYLISQCVSNYVSHHPDELRPHKVIATDGRKKQIFLNYIHQPNVNGENMTIRLLPQQKDNSELCQ